MKEYDLNQLIANRELLNAKLQNFINIQIILKQAPDEAEIKGHIEKAEHNLQFIKDNLKLGYND